MARIRTIKPDFFRHEELYQAEIESKLPLRVAFAGLFTVADREGRFRWKAKQIKIDVMPWDDVDFNLILAALCERGFIRKYTVDGKTYGDIPSFTAHQVINNKESKSNLPPWTRDGDASFTRLSRDGDASLTEGKGREGREHTRTCLCSVFGKSYKAPEERMPAEANFYKDIDIQTERLLEVFEPDKAIEQIKAYIHHCRISDRKMIGHAYKLSETILSADWVKLNNPESQATDNPFRQAEENKQNWKPEEWQKHYSKEIMFNPKFKQHFNLV